jgi:hypothetical protein
MCVIVSWISLRIFKMGVQGRGGIAACIIDFTLPRDNGFSIYRFLCTGLVCPGRGEWIFKCLDEGVRKKLGKTPDEVELGLLAVDWVYWPSCRASHSVFTYFLCHKTVQPNNIRPVFSKSDLCYFEYPTDLCVDLLQISVCYWKVCESDRTKSHCTQTEINA